MDFHYAIIYGVIPATAIFYFLLMAVRFICRLLPF